MATAAPVVLMCENPMFPYLEEALSSKFSFLRLWEAEDGSAFLKQHGDSVRALVVTPEVGAPATMIDAFPKLEIISTCSVGFDKIDLKKCRERNVVVTNTPGVLTDSTADMAMGLLLCTMRRICQADRFIRRGLWPVQADSPPLTHEVSGRRVGILGLGRIGSAIAKRCEGFNCKILYYSRKKKHVPYTHFDNLVELAKSSEILVVACALNEETRHIVNREVIDALGPEGTLINIARGAIIDEGELVNALVEGRLGGAGLDVFEQEPHVPKALWNMDNVVLQPHVASGTWKTQCAVVDLVVANLEAHFSGKSLPTPVNLN